MEIILKQFNLPSDEMADVLRNTQSIIAGSAPLCALVNGSWIPNDLDIWFHDTYTDTDDKNTTKFQMINKTFDDFFDKYGYKRLQINRGDISEYRNTDLIDIIRRIDIFKNDDGKTIQLINTRHPVNNSIQKYFDISCCVSWWDPSLENPLNTYDLNSTIAAKMYSLKSNLTSREKDRLKKYLSRGFQIIQNPNNP
jgi:hypothetical protein